MEEILASIRRIISDDDVPKASPKQPETAVAGATVSNVPPSVSPAAQAPASSTPPIAAPDPAMSQSEIDVVLANSETPAAEPAASARVPEAETEILELTEAMAASESDSPSFRTIEGVSDVVFSEAPDEPPPPRTSTPSGGISTNSARTVGDTPLLSSSTNSAVDAAFNALARTVLVQNSRTLEDLVKEMMRPMLKSWLDDNLPGMVERLIKAEIERVSRGR